jgi:SAM-dependent methyltransferase
VRKCGTHNNYTKWTDLKTHLLTADSLLQSYDAVCSLYPHVPSLVYWRAWEHAAYKCLELSGLVLDLGCGDGRYFRLAWPRVRDAIGVDMDPRVVSLARTSGIYREVHECAAHLLPDSDNSFDNVFANCSLEHMDCLAQVLSEIHRTLKKGGALVCSVVTDRFLSWAPIPRLVSEAGYEHAAKTLEAQFIEYHHVVNPLTFNEWIERFTDAGLVVEHHFPILPKYSSGLFLLIDQLWHVSRPEGGELGDIIFPLLRKTKDFRAGFRKMFEGMLDLESDWVECSGAVFCVRKPD